VSFFDPAALAELLGIPPGGKPVALLCLGHVEAFYPRPLLESAAWEKRRALEDLVFENCWDRRAFGEAEE
jgi:5,6-dimethylbenzimidazole synthase